MISVTIDTNLVIDLEEKRQGWENVQKLIELHSEGKIELNVPAIMASEKFVDSKPVDNFNNFKTFVEQLGFTNVEFLPPILYFGITFLDYHLLASKDMIKLEKEIHNIMFPNIEFEYSEYCKNSGIDINKKPLDKDWLNAKCDVLSIWSHIYHKKGVFITKDTDFHKNKDKLIGLGVKKILYPGEIFSKMFREELI